MGDTLGSRWVVERVKRTDSTAGSFGTLGTNIGLDDISFSKTVGLDLMDALVDSKITFS